MSLKIFAKTVEQEVHDQLKQLMSVNVFKDANKPVVEAFKKYIKSVY